ncbi:MAG: cytidylate kinase-like family protein [Rhodospirillales bacterium]|nr:MAG: cytidylate kinase-like family protein [Rhodospirillales bacterium]
MPHIHSAIQSIISSIGIPGGAAEAKEGQRLVVCISRDYGCGGETIGKKLAERLGVRYFSKEVLEKIVERTHMDAEVVKTLEEKTQKARDLWLYSLFTGKDASADTYKRHMVNIILSLSRVGGVIVGRGSHVILGHTKALRVRLIGTLDKCAQRVAHEDSISFEEAKHRIQEHNAQRGKYVWEMFHSRLNDPAAFDLVVNVDRLGDIEHVTEMLADAAKAVTEGTNL